MLFIVGTLQSGGVSKSLVNLLNVWDSEKYETSLLLCCKEGDVFSEFIPPGVKVLYSAEIEHCMGGVRSAFWFIKKGHLLIKALSFNLLEGFSWVVNISDDATDY